MRWAGACSEGQWTSNILITFSLIVQVQHSTIISLKLDPHTRPGPARHPPPLSGRSLILAVLPVVKVFLCNYASIFPRRGLRPELPNFHIGFHRTAYKSHIYASSGSWNMKLCILCQNNYPISTLFDVQSLSLLHDVMYLSLMFTCHCYVLVTNLYLSLMFTCHSCLLITGLYLCTCHWCLLVTLVYLSQFCVCHCCVLNTLFTCHCCLLVTVLISFV